VEAGLEAADGAQVQRQEVEEQGAVGFGRQRDELAFGVGVGGVVDVLDIGGLPAQAGAVIYNFTIDFPRSVVDESQSRSLLPAKSAGKQVVDVLVRDFGER